MADSQWGSRSEHCTDQTIIAPRGATRAGMHCNRKIVLIEIYALIVDYLHLKISWNQHSLRIENWSFPQKLLDDLCGDLLMFCIWLEISSWGCVTSDQCQWWLWPGRNVVSMNGIPSEHYSSLPTHDMLHSSAPLVTLAPHSYHLFTVKKN